MPRPTRGDHRRRWSVGSAVRPMRRYVIRRTGRGRRGPLSGRIEAERVEAGVEPLDHDGRARPCEPVLAGQPPALQLPGDATRRESHVAVRPIAQRPGHGVRRMVVEEGAAHRDLGAEAVEGEGERRRRSEERRVGKEWGAWWGPWG